MVDFTSNCYLLSLIQFVVRIIAHFVKNQCILWESNSLLIVCKTSSPTITLPEVRWLENSYLQNLQGPIAKMNSHSVRIELTINALLDQLANNYTTWGNLSWRQLFTMFSLVVAQNPTYRYSVRINNNSQRSQLMNHDTTRSKSFIWWLLFIKLTIQEIHSNQTNVRWDFNYF